MKAGLELFGTAGFAKTTIPLLCSAAGVTARHFYDEFPSREALLRTLYDEIADATHERVLEALRVREVSMRERIRQGNIAFFRSLTSDPRLARIYVLEAVGISAELELHRRAKREAYVKSLTKAAQHLEKRGLQTAVDSRLLAAALAGAIHDLLLEWVLSARRPSIDKLVDTVTTLWVRTLLIDRYELEL